MEDKVSKVLVVDVRGEDAADAIVWDENGYNCCFNLKYSNKLDKYLYNFSFYAPSLMAAAAVLEASQGIDVKKMKEVVHILMNESHSAFVKAVISEELNIDSEEKLNRIYSKYMAEDEINLLSREVIDYSDSLKIKKHHEVDAEHTL